MKKIDIILPYQLLKQMETFSDHDYRTIMDAIVQFVDYGTTLETGDEELDSKIVKALKLFNKGIDNKDIKDRANKLFDYFWNLYPRKNGKEQARKTWAKKFKVCKTIEEVDSKAKKIFTIFKATNQQWIDDQRDLAFVPYFSSWLNMEIPDKEK